MKTVEEASLEILSAFAPIGEERVPLLDGLGRHASVEILARHPAPAFANSAMDGYAVRAADIAQASAGTPVVLPVHGESRAGTQTLEPLAMGAAMRIFTGAPLPEGADSVVVQEDTERIGADVRIRFAAKQAHHVRSVGSDFTADARLIAQGDLLNAAALALLASQDHASVRVFRRPRVAVLCTGDELRDIGEPARPFGIVNSNAYGLAAQILEAGATPVVLPSVGDEVERVADAVVQGLGCDVLLLSGGVSVGDYDVVLRALERAGVTLDFWKVSMKPGKPLSFGHAGRVPVLGLPGNPVSSWVAFELFVRPGLRKMLGDPAPQRTRLHVKLARPISRTPGRTEFLRARLTYSEGIWLADPLQRQDSSSLSSLSQVDALLVVPKERDALHAQESLTALVLRTPGHPGALSICP